MGFFQNERKRAERRGWPIHAYVGANGSGKSAAMVWDTLPSLEQGRPVLSTVRILDWKNPRECEGCDEPGHERPVYGPAIVGERVREWKVQQAAALGIPVDELPDELIPEKDEHGFPLREVVGVEIHRAAHPLYVRFHRWEQLLEAHGCDVLMDEVTGVSSSRESHSMPQPVANLLQQLRRRDVVLRWTAPAWRRADIIIRECSIALTYCTGYLAKSSRDGSRIWRQRRLFRWATYDANEFEDWTVGQREELRSLVRDWHWGPRSPVFQAYDTYDSVAAIETVTEGGTCYRCGGYRRRPSCRCGDHGNGGAGDADSAGPRRGARRRPLDSGAGVPTTAVGSAGRHAA